MEKQTRENIIFYFTDQQRFDTCGCYGQPLDITPNLDKLAKEGVIFENAFSAQPVCGPCRAIFQTGLYPTDTGCFRNGIMLPNNVKTLANYLEEDGYETAYIGKWHLASQNDLEGNHEVDHRTVAIPKELRGGYSGYWRASDVLEFTSHGYDGYVFDENNEKREFKGYRADAITDFAIDFFEVRDKEKPFFMTISHIEPHHQNDNNCYEGPLGSKEKYKDFVLPEDLKALNGDSVKEYPDYLGACKSLDDNLGNLINKLKEEGIYENTTIIFSSDHGSHFRTRNNDGHLYGYDDYKRSAHDASTHVPFVIKSSKLKSNISVKELISTASLPKTILAIAGIEIGDKMIGENLIEVTTKQNTDRENEVFIQISESRVGRAIRTENFLYAIYAPNISGDSVAYCDTYYDDYLYDMIKDKYQLNNVVTDTNYKEVKKSMRERLLASIKKAENRDAKIIDG